MAALPPRRFEELNIAAARQVVDAANTFAAAEKAVVFSDKTLRFWRE